MADISEELIQQRLEEYTKTRGSKDHSQNATVNAAYAVVDKEGDLFRVPYHTCFGRLNLLGGHHGIEAGVEAIFVQLQRDLPELDKKANLYYEWLFNFSPWRDVFVTKDQNSALKKGVIHVDTNIDSSLMIGGMISVRHPWESFTEIHFFKGAISLWTKMVEAGANPNYAFVVCMGLCGQRDGWSLRGCQSGHQALVYGPSELNNNIHANFVADRSVRDNEYSFKNKNGYRKSTLAFSSPRSGLVSHFKWMENAIRSISTGKSASINPFLKTETENILNDNQVIGGFLEMQGDYLERIKA